MTPQFKENYTAGYEAGQRFFDVVLDKLPARERWVATIAALQGFSDALEANKEERKDEA